MNNSPSPVPQRTTSTDPAGDGQRFRISSLTARVALTGFMVAQLSGCTSWGPPRLGSTAPVTGRVQVWQGGQRRELDRVAMTPDSIVGRAAFGQRDFGKRAAIARAGVDSIRVRRTSAGRTILAGLAGVAVAGTAAAGIALASIED